VEGYGALEVVGDMAIGDILRLVWKLGRVHIRRDDK
jgi:hypothetical protein